MNMYIINLKSWDWIHDYHDRTRSITAKCNPVITCTMEVESRSSEEVKSIAKHNHSYPNNNFPNSATLPGRWVSISCYSLTSLIGA